MRTLVTGGAGFIGSHLVERLLEEGAQVTVLDNLSSGCMENLQHLRKRSRLRFHRVDIAGHNQLRRYFQGVEWVFHLAALADIVPSIQKPGEYFRANAAGTLAVLEASRAAKVHRFLYAASSSCYGIPGRYPTSEIAPVAPQYPYALTKWLGEQMVLHWGQVYGLPAVSLRLFNVYGPKARTSGAYGAVFGVFLAQKAHGKPLTVVGDGSQTRDFTYVTDVVEAFLGAAKSSLRQEILNVGSGHPRSINDLARLLGGPRVRIPQRPGEPDCTWADIGKIATLLKWKPKVDFEEGVKMLLRNMRQWEKAPVWTPRSIRKATKAWFQYLG